MKNLFLFFFVLCLSACQNKTPNLGIAQNHLPSTSLLQKGIIDTYYTLWVYPISHKI